MRAAHAPGSLAAHPRSRGENFATLACAGVRGGSSPLTRGKPSFSSPSRQSTRLIPAHAGKTLSHTTHLTPLTAHPRSRGENVNDYFVNYCVEGSSPLTRGKPWSARRRGSRRGLIPAHAGKTGARPRRRLGSPAHPRSRGENGECARQGPASLGSSPLTRGKLLREDYVPTKRRLIPAHAGKTGTMPGAGPSLWAHPRSRGENLYCGKRGFDGRGSSPLTRGKPVPALADSGAGGLIPAHAGKTAARQRPLSAQGAHPRSRGENIASRRIGPRSSGSSPLTRGKQRRRAVAVTTLGLIPAHAGKTHPSASARTSPTAHPRSRGENHTPKPCT